MIQVHFEGNEVVVSGEIEEGDIYQDICCKGHGWKVLLILPLPGDVQSVYGRCENPECAVNVSDWMYGGAPNFDGEELALLVGEAMQ